MSFEKLLFQGKHTNKVQLWITLRLCSILFFLKFMFFFGFFWAFFHSKPCTINWNLEAFGLLLTLLAPNPCGYSVIKYQLFYCFLVLVLLILIQFLVLGRAKFSCWRIYLYYCVLLCIFLIAQIKVVYWSSFLIFQMVFFGSTFVYVNRFHGAHVICWYNFHYCLLYFVSWNDIFIVTIYVGFEGCCLVLAILLM